MTAADIRLWGRDWHALGTKTLPSEPYNAALQAITDRFTMRGAAPGRFNGNAINQVRTNEIALASPWQLRQFQLGANPANLATPDNPAGATRLLPAPIALTPDISFNGTAVLTSYINANATAIPCR